MSRRPSLTDEQRDMTWRERVYDKEMNDEPAANRGLLADIELADGVSALQSALAHLDRRGTPCHNHAITQGIVKSLRVLVDKISEHVEGCESRGWNAAYAKLKPALTARDIPKLLQEYYEIHAPQGEYDARYRLAKWPIVRDGTPQFIFRHFHAWLGTTGKASVKQQALKPLLLIAGYHRRNLTVQGIDEPEHTQTWYWSIVLT